MRKDHSQIDFSLLNYVDDVDHFQNHLQGYLLWETIYNSVDSTLNNKGEKFKKAHLKNSNHNVVDTTFMALR